MPALVYEALSREEIEAAAAAIINQRLLRRGFAKPLENPLELLTPLARHDAWEDAEAALRAARAIEAAR